MRHIKVMLPESKRFDAFSVADYNHRQIRRYARVRSTARNQVHFYAPENACRKRKSRSWMETLSKPWFSGSGIRTVRHRIFRHLGFVHLKIFLTLAIPSPSVLLGFLFVTIIFATGMVRHTHAFWLHFSVNCEFMFKHLQINGTHKHYSPYYYSQLYSMMILLYSVDVNLGPLASSLSCIATNNSWFLTWNHQK
jgi:hypothetical protein